MSSNYVVPEIEDEVTCWLLAQHPDASIRAYAVASPFADDSIIELLLTDESLMVVQAAVYRPRLPHTSEAAAAVRKNDALVAKAMAGLVPPDRDTVLWLYEHGGPGAKSASVRIISQDRNLILRGLAEDRILDRDVRIILNGGALRPEDHPVLIEYPNQTVREWVLGHTKDVEVLKRLTAVHDNYIAEQALQRLERLEPTPGLF